MISNGQNFPDVIPETRTMFVVYSSPNNPALGQHGSLEEAIKAARPGQVVYEVKQMTISRAVFVKSMKAHTP